MTAESASCSGSSQYEDVEALRAQRQPELDEDALVRQVGELENVGHRAERVAPGRHLRRRRPVPELVEEPIGELVRESRLGRIGDELLRSCPGRGASLGHRPRTVSIPVRTRVQLRRREPADAIREGGWIQRYDLRDVGHGIARQAGCTLGQPDVAGRARPLQVAGEWDGDNGPQRAAVEAIALDHDDRWSKAWLRPRRIRQIGPTETSPCEITNRSTRGFAGSPRPRRDRSPPLRRRRLGRGPQQSRLARGAPRNRGVRRYRHRSANDLRVSPGAQRLRIRHPAPRRPSSYPEYNHGWRPQVKGNLRGGLGSTTARWTRRGSSGRSAVGLRSTHLSFRSGGAHTERRGILLPR